MLLSFPLLFSLVVYCSFSCPLPPSRLFLKVLLGSSYLFLLVLCSFGEESSHEIVFTLEQSVLSLTEP